MAAKYLLPCPQCEATQSVSAIQAGEIITCGSCQAEVEVPKLSGIKQLQIVESDAPKPSSNRSWSHAQGVYFSTGLALLIVGGAIAGFLIQRALKRDVSNEEFEEIVESLEGVDDFTIGETWEVWEQTIETNPLGEWRESKLEANRRLRRAELMIATPACVVGVIGLGLVVYSFVPRKPKRRRRKKPPAKPKSGES